MLRRLLAFAVLFATVPCLAAPPALGLCDFRLPVVDAIPNSPSFSGASYAIWSYTRVQEPAGNTITVTFPSGMTPASLPLGQTVFMKFTYTGSGGAFLNTEVPATATQLSGGTVTVQLPWTLDVGTFYVRFDKNFGLTNPANWGTHNIVLGDDGGNLISSQGYYIGLTGVASSCVLSGQVTNNSGSPIPGALVNLVSTDGSSVNFPLRATWGPQQATASDAWGATLNSYSTLTDAKGNYIFSVPAGSYQVSGKARSRTGGGEQSTAASSVSLGSSPLVQNLTINVTR